MIDFLMVSTRYVKNGIVEIYPKFIIKNSQDLMIRGGDFYAIWVEEKGLWSTDEQDALRLIDEELDSYAKKHAGEYGQNYKVLHMWDAETGMIDRWHKYCQQQLRDSYNVLDEKLIFSNYETHKNDYASKRLSYPLEEGNIDAYDKLISTLYAEEERRKIEWAIGAIVSGDSKEIQKFMVLYGSAGTGKSTILNIIDKLFSGYTSVFDAKALGSSSNAFALEAFKHNPLVAIQHDGDLSRIEDNTRLNSLISHEIMTVNEKYKSQYSNRFKCFLFVGTNRPVKITDAKSGLIRRLIDVSPSGNKLNPSEYKKIMSKIDEELGAIAKHCLNVYLDNPNLYDNYIPITMLGASNDFYNFVADSYYIFQKEDCTSLKTAWEMYKNYCDEAKVSFPLSQRAFKEELKNYFKEYFDRVTLSDGSRIRNYYKGFISDKFESVLITKDSIDSNITLELNSEISIFDDECSSCKAQYANSDGTPMKKWRKVTTTLSDIDTTKLHFVQVPLNHIVIDFDIKDENGNKSRDKNLEAASKWPPTYAEFSKSGAGVHLHYIYDGDVSRLSSIYDENIEVKVFNGDASLRRCLSLCNNLPIATISSGLPLKGEKMVNFTSVKSEKRLRLMIIRNLKKEIHAGTKPSVDFIYKILEDAYNDGLRYDVTDMRNAILAFAAKSTNHAEYCIKLVGKMKFCSDDISENVLNDDQPLVFYDVEVFPNLFLVNWKYRGEQHKCVRMINPSPQEIEGLVKNRLIGFNCRRYDNHILYARMMGYSNEELFRLSQRIVVEKSKNCFFGEAYNLSYTDVHDYAAKKQSLKKWEIELKIHHKELGLPWNQPVPEEKWIEVAEYCDNDVYATEAVFEHTQSDFLARQILAEIAGLSVNDTTNSLTTRIIFGKNRHPQSEFNYRDLGKVDETCSSCVVTEDMVLYDYDMFDKGVSSIQCHPTDLNNPDFKDIIESRKIKDNEPLDDICYTLFNDKNQPVFPGYKFERGKSYYRGEEVGEGGYVYAKPGMYTNVALLDIASMHPSSAIAEKIFGEKYTAIFAEIKQARIYIKHKEFDKAKSLPNIGSKLAKFLNDESVAKGLAQALKIAINSVYGLTMASFENPFRDNRNIDNIVAKRGALFMINLKHEVQKRGYTVAHIKTDSIKIPNADKDIIDFVIDYGKMYGYDFEHEATYERMCLVNDAVYIAKYDHDEHWEENDIDGNLWTATGTQFAVPYVFKTLFSKEPIEFDDLCYTVAVSKGDLYLDMNEGLPDVSEYELLRDIRNIVKDEGLNNVMTSDVINWSSIQGSSTRLRKMDVNMFNEFNNLSDEYIDKKINSGHNKIYVGRVGRFCPIKNGEGGGIIYRVNDGKDYAAAGTKGYRWLESETVKTLGLEYSINLEYFDRLAIDAMQSISEWGDFDWFINGKIEDFNPIPFDGPYQKVKIA